MTDTTLRVHSVESGSSNIDRSMKTLEETIDLGGEENGPFPPGERDPGEPIAAGKLGDQVLEAIEELGWGTDGVKDAAALDQPREIGDRGGARRGHCGEDLSLRREPMRRLSSFPSTIGEE